MALLFVVFVIEILFAFTVYFLLRRLRGTRYLIALAVGASLIALVAGWTAGYRATANTVIRDFRDQTNAQLQRSRGAGLSESEWHQMLEKLKVDPEVEYLSHKGAAIHALPGFVIVLLIMVGLAKKHEKQSKNFASA